MIILTTYLLFNVMFSFKFHAETFFVYLHSFRLWFVLAIRMVVQV